MGKIPRNMNGVFELTRRNSPGEHLQPLSPLDPPPKGGGLPEIFGTRSRCGFRGCPEKKIGTRLETAGRMVSWFFARGATQNFRDTPAAVSEGVPTRKIGTRPELRENWCPDFFGGGGMGPPLRGVAGIPSAQQTQGLNHAKQKFDMLCHATCSQHHGHARLCTVRFATNLSWWLLSESLGGLWQAFAKVICRRYMGWIFLRGGFTCLDCLAAGGSFPDAQWACQVCGH